MTVGEDTFVLKTTYLDNAFLPQSYIDTLEQMRVNNPTYYRIYALGEFCSLDKLVFDNWILKEFDHTQIDGQLAIGIDFGFTNDLCTIVSSIETLKSYQIIVNPKCKGLIEEFQNYSWQKDKLTNEYVNKPVDKYNHYIDALRYSLQCLGNNKVRSMSKAAFGL